MPPKPSTGSARRVWFGAFASMLWPSALLAASIEMGKDRADYDGSGGRLQVAR